MRKQITTKTTIEFTAAESSGCTIICIPLISSATNVIISPTMNSASRVVRQ